MVNCKKCPIEDKCKKIEIQDVNVAYETCPILYAIAKCEEFHV